MITIQVSRVPEQGLTEQRSLDPAALDMEREDVRFHEPVTVEAFVTKVDSELMVKADIRFTLYVVCARCLEEFVVPLQTDAFFSYQVEPADVVDITDDVRQEVMLAYPMVPVCQSACKGLCSVCGKNLNTSACPHAGAGAQQGKNPGEGDGATQA
jgi:uncharacterized protein